MNITLNQAALIRRSLKTNPRPIYNFANKANYDLNDIRAVAVRGEHIKDRVIWLAGLEELLAYNYDSFPQQDFNFLMRWLQQ